MHEPTVKIDRGLIKGVIQVLNSVNFNYKPCVKEKKKKNGVLIKYCLKTTPKTSKRQKLDKIYNEYSINVFGCFLTKGKVVMRSALMRYYNVLFLVQFKKAI